MQTALHDTSEHRPLQICNAYNEQRNLKGSRAQPSGAKFLQTSLQRIVHMDGGKRENLSTLISLISRQQQRTDAINCCLEIRPLVGGKKGNSPMAGGSHTEEALKRMPIFSAQSAGDLWLLGALQRTTQLACSLQIYWPT